MSVCECVFLMPFLEFDRDEREKNYNVIVLHAVTTLYSIPFGRNLINFISFHSIHISWLVFQHIDPFSSLNHRFEGRVSEEKRKKQIFTYFCFSFGCCCSTVNYVNCKLLCSFPLGYLVLGQTTKWFAIYNLTRSKLGDSKTI